MSRTAATEPRGVEDAGAGDGREGDLASLTRRPRCPAVLGRARCSGATTLSTRSSEIHTGARGTSYAGFTLAAVAVPRVEHLLAQEPALLLLAVLGSTLPAAGAFLEETGIGGELGLHFLAVLPQAPRTGSSCACQFPARDGGGGNTATGANGRQAPPPPLALLGGRRRGRELQGRRRARSPRALGVAASESASSKGGGHKLQGRRLPRRP